MTGKLSLLARAALLIGLGAAAPLTAAPPLAAFGQLPAINSVALSPDGKRYAAIVGGEGEAQIQVRSLADGKLISVSAVTKAKARGLYWAGSNHLLAMVSTTQRPPAGISGGRSEWYQLQDLDLTTRSSRLLLTGVKNTMNIVTGRPAPIAGSTPPATVVAGMPFIIGQGAETLIGVSGLYRVDLTAGTTVLTDTGTSKTVDWVVDGSGKAVARADYDQLKQLWTLWVRPGGEWLKAHTETAALDLPELLALGEDGSVVLVRSYDGTDWGIHPVAIASGEWGAALTGVEADDLIIDPVTRRVVATITTDMEAVHYRFADPGDQKSWEAIVKAFPGELVTLQSWSDDRMVVIVHIEGHTNGDGYFVVDRRARQARPLGARYPGIGPDDIGERRVVRYKAGDGLEIPAYLTLPKARLPKLLPLVVLPHGGPVARDDPGFDWWAHALASRGYAVLQPQFRGSDGLGGALKAAAYGQYGRAMQTDLSDGVAYLAAQGIVDPARVCIAGASYGGYAALAGVALQSGIYRCAASLAGPSDVRMQLGGKARYRVNPSRSEGLRFWLRLTGAKASDDPLLDTLSPVKSARNIKVPVLLMHGKDDTVVPFEQSRVMEKALLAAGGRVELVTLAGEDHWLSRAQTRVQMLNVLVDFLERHNPPGAVAAK